MSISTILFKHNRSAKDRERKPMRSRALLTLLACPLLLAGGAHAQVQSAAAPVPWDRAHVLALAEKAADYQIDQLARGIKPNPNMKAMPAADGWEQGAFFVGLAMLADHSPRPELAQALQDRGAANGYAFGARQYDADDQTIGAAYFWDYRHGAGQQAIAAMRARMDAILAHPPTNDLVFEGDGHTCRDRWCWADALFMGPQVWLDMSRATGDPKYAAYAKHEFFATVGALYDPQERLFYRDSRFKDRRDANGSKLFWSRGDGWVFAGIARMLDLIPADDPDRPKIVAVFRQMAAKLKSIQKPDGFWSPSLLGDPQTALPEESGTAFYTYGMAWGVKNGVLDRATYTPVVRSGWAALNRALHPDGRVGYVQPVSDRPDAVDYDDTQFYGVGGFLMAASMVADLDLKPIEPVRTLAVSNPSAYDQPAAPLTIAAAAGADDTKAAGGWSVVMDGRVYAAQCNADDHTVSFVLPLKAHQKTRVQLVPQAAPLPLRVQAILNIQDGGAADPATHQVRGGTFHLHQSYTVPAGHVFDDQTIAFEGVGWESDKAAYRLYLDDRNAVDLFGKKRPGPVLQDIGQANGNYADLTAAWGADIYQVGQSLGLGGLGERRDGKATQIGASAVTASVRDDGPVSARAMVVHSGIDGDGRLEATYVIRTGSPLTRVDAVATGLKGPLVAGIARHDKVEVLSGTTPGGWGYVASWGPQSLAGDDLGTVLFFRAAEIEGPYRDDGRTLYVTFKSPQAAHYALAATWVQDGSGVRSLADFKAWLAATADGLNHPASVR
jgi:rhamnogalacturonyl hydrolase YesR